MNWLKAHSLYLAWLFAFAGFLLSVYFGEILNVEPCRLCWYQRIAVFPLALFLGIAAYRNERRIAMYCLPFAALGLLAAFYQLISQLVPALHSPYLCGTTQCTLSGISPFLTTGGFLAITFFILITPRRGS